MVVVARSSELSGSIYILLWLGVQSSLYFAGLGVPSYLYFAVAWGSELSFMSGLVYPGDPLFAPWSGLSTRE